MSMFQSRAWQEAWWNRWGDTPGFAYVQGGGGGVSGLYLDQYWLNGIFPVHCLQFVGCNYRRLSTPRTEYNCLTKKGEGARIDAVVQDLEKVHWTEAVLRDMCTDSREFRSTVALAKARAWSVRMIHHDRAYSIATGDSFYDYLSSLGSSTRLKFYNRRKLLHTLGSVEEENLWPDNVDLFFTYLNQFHKERWGNPCFSPESQAFHRDFLLTIPREGGVPELMALRCNGEVISVVYNVAYSGRTYNIQSGFNESFHKKLAVGSLHLGYCIERAFAAPDIKVFDLLAGSGKNTNYKARIATDTVDLASIMIVRNAFFRTLYKLKDGPCGQLLRQFRMGS